MLYLKEYHIHFTEVYAVMAYRDFYQKALGITDPQLLRQLSAASTEEVLPRGQRLVRMGEHRHSIHFLLHGILRGFIVDENGKDITDCFICQQGDVIAGCGSLIGPSNVSIEGITDCTVLALPLDRLQDLMENPQLMYSYNEQLSIALDRHWEMKMMLYRCSAMERYQWFRKRYPGLEEHISGKHLASFLGVTPVTLSRLRRQLKDSE